MSFQLCLCGTQAGYPHAADCPRPLFRGTPAQDVAWVDERHELRAQLAMQTPAPLALVVEPPPAPPAPSYERIDRDQAIARIRKALQERSGKAWSVTGGRGTAWGWIRITAPPRRCTWSTRPVAQAVEGRGPLGREEFEAYDTGLPGRSMSPADRAELGQLLGHSQPVYADGESIAASNDYYREFVDRAEGRAPSVVGRPYWD